jgi:hypothetical protein
LPARPRVGFEFRVWDLGLTDKPYGDRAETQNSELKTQNLKYGAPRAIFGLPQISRFNCMTDPA